MSFRTAYSDYKRGSTARKPQGYLRDPTPKEWERTIDEHRKQQTKNQYPSNWSRWG
jgi:hypothetical protein